MSLDAGHFTCECVLQLLHLVISVVAVPWLTSVTIPSNSANHGFRAGVWECNTGLPALLQQLQRELQQRTV